ncbi:MAG: hypothetical protein ACE5OS_03705 [Anaerolineae bacterium]
MTGNGFSARQAIPVIGLVIGLALGLAYTWGIAPVKLVNTDPALLRTDYRWDWVRLAALSYVADGDLERARARLDGLRQEDVAGALEALIEEYTAAGRPADTLRSLTTLAEALDVHTPAMLVYLRTPGASPPVPTRTPSPVPTPTSSPTPTPTPYASSPLPTPTSSPTSTPVTPTLTPTPSPTPPLLSRLRLAQQEQICEPGQTPRVEVVVRDEHGAGLAGVELWLIWPGGADRAVTGLKPRYGAGYADFGAEAGVRYSLGVGELGMPLVTDLRIEACPVEEGEEPLMGSWHVVLAPGSPEGE